MSNKNNGSYNAGIGLPGLATLAFVILKLCGVIDWSWWWVLSPTWIPIAIALAAIAVAGICALISYFIINDDD